MDALTTAQQSGLASEVALAKAAWFLDHQAFTDAVTVLKVSLRFHYTGNAMLALSIQASPQHVLWAVLSGSNDTDLGKMMLAEVK